MLPRLVFIAALALLTGLFNPLKAETIQLSPVQDNTLFEDDEGDLSNGAGAWLYFGLTGPNDDVNLRRALLKFNVSAIPPNAIIEQVELVVEIDKAPNSGLPGTADLHRVTSNWGEAGSVAPGAGGGGAAAQSGDATWLHGLFDTSLWTTPGGDFESQISSSAAFSSGAPEALTFSSTPQMVGDVQAWVKDASINHGWIIIGDEFNEVNARRIASKECDTNEFCTAAEPELTVEYSIPSVTDFLALQPLSTSLDNPIGLAHAGDGSGRLFIIEQGGRILIYHTDTGMLDTTSFLDIESMVYSSEDLLGGGGFIPQELGLLGLAFHPDYSNNGRFFINYTSNPQNSDITTVVAEYTASEDPDEANSTGTVLMEFVQERNNHNGGNLVFGPDGYLYISSGDGGGGGDPEDNAQDVDTLRGTILRIDVDNPRDAGAEHCGLVNDYAIPPGNAFPGGSDGCDAILHIGLRNPWRISFDAQTGALLISDVGQGSREEINFVPGGTAASGINFGWPCYEGSIAYDGPAGCSGTLTFPTYEYAHVGNTNGSITGGFVYRGGNLPINGKYVFGDYISRQVWFASGDGTGLEGNWSVQEWEGTSGTLNSLASFGQDEQCELYVLDRNALDQAGALYRIEDTNQLFTDQFENRLCR